MIKTCPQCKSERVSDKTAEFYYLLTAILSVIGTVLVFVSWPWSFLVITAMLVCVILAVDLPKRTYKCKDCSHEWKEGYNAAGDFSTFSPEKDTVG